MSVLANELSNSIESILAKVKRGTSVEQTPANNTTFTNNHDFFILDHEPTGAVSQHSSNTNAVSIPFSSKYRGNQRIRLGNTHSPSPSGISSATANGSISRQSLKESLNKTISSIIENCQERIIIHNNSPSSSYSFTKHSTIICSPSKASKVSKSSNSSSFSKSKLSPSNIFVIKKIKPNSLNEESKSSEITFGLKKKDIPSKHKKSNSVDGNLGKIDTEVIDSQLKKSKKTMESSDIKVEQIKKEQEMKEEIKSDNIPNNADEITKEDIKSEVKVENSIESIKPIETKIETENTKSEKLNEKEDKIEVKEDIKNSEVKKEENKIKGVLQKKKSTLKKTRSLPNMLSALTPLSGMDDANVLNGRRRRKSVNFSSDSFKSICVFTTTDKPENIKGSVVEVKIDDPESDKKDKEFSELRNYENAWSSVPRNVIHIQKFKSSKAKHVQYELPVSIQSFKLVKGNSEETEDKLTCLKVTLNVQNLNFDKKVVIRYTVDKWKSFKEVEAKYVKCIREATNDDEGDGVKNVVGLERFVARIPVGEYFVLEEKPGHICNQRPTKMLLVARYEVNNNTYWDNNDFTDYHIELVRINAGYDVPRVSKHGKPIPCPGCCMSGKQNDSVEDKGKDIKNNKRAVRKIGGVFGNFTEAVAKNNERTNFMADKEKINLYMGMDNKGNKRSTTLESKKNNSPSTKETKALKEEPQSNARIEEKPKKRTVSKKKIVRPRPHSYCFGCSPSMGGSPMYSMLSNYSANKTSTDTTTSTNDNSFYSNPKYNPPMSTTSSLYSNSSMGMSCSSYGSNSCYPSTSKYEPSPYNGGVSYDPSAYGSGVSTVSKVSSASSTSSSKYDPPSEYSENQFSKYNPPKPYTRSYSNPLPSPYGSVYSSSSMYNPYDKSSNQMDTQFGNFSEYNFGISSQKPSQNANNSNDRSNSKYDIPFSTYSSFGDNYSNYYSVSPSVMNY